MEASANNVAGHRAKYNHLISHLPPKEAGIEYVGGADPVLMGFFELEVLRLFKKMDGASVLDIGCGIGRLTKYLIDENLSGYLGLDIIPEILVQAELASREQPNFKFAIAEDAKVPAADSTFDVVCAFSLITHLLDEEIFEYFVEAKRVLRPSGVAIFSFLDLDEAGNRELFFKHAREHRHGHGDLLRFTTRPILKYFAEEAGFSAISFINNNENIVSTTKRATLIDGRESPVNGLLGQSICVMQTA